MTVHHHTLLRSRGAKDSSKVGWVELFFDLVFVFSVTQLSHLLLADLTWNGAAEATFLMLAVWVAWMWTTWAMNWLDTRHAAVRVLLFVLMAAGLVLSAAIPEAFEERALAFACAYVVIHNARTLFTVFALRGGHSNEYVNFIRIEIWLAFASIFWIAGALAEGEARWTLWLTALAIDFFAPWVRFWCPGLGSSSIADWSVDPAHIAERCGLFVIIALGESVIMTGATFAELQWDPYNAAGFAASFIGTVAMWWVYFATTAEEASELFERRYRSRHARARGLHLRAHPDHRRYYPDRGRRRIGACPSGRPSGDECRDDSCRRTGDLPSGQRSLPLDDLRRCAGLARHRVCPDRDRGRDVLGGPARRDERGHLARALLRRCVGSDPPQACPSRTGASALASLAPRCASRSICFPPLRAGEVLAKASGGGRSAASKLADRD